MDIRNVFDACSFSSEKMQKVNLFATNELFVDLYCLEPGQKQKVHAHDDASKVYVVLEGHGYFTIGEDERELGPGQAVVACAGDPHGVENRDEERLILLVTMAPPPMHA